MRTEKFLLDLSVNNFLSYEEIAWYVQIQFMFFFKYIFQPKRKNPSFVSLFYSSRRNALEVKSRNAKICCVIEFWWGERIGYYHVKTSNGYLLSRLIRLVVNLSHRNLLISQLPVHWGFSERKSAPGRTDLLIAIPKLIRSTLFFPSQERMIYTRRAGTSYPGSTVLQLVGKFLFVFTFWLYLLQQFENTRDSSPLLRLCNFR